MSSKTALGVFEILWVSFVYLSVSISVLNADTFALEFHSENAILYSVVVSTCGLDTVLGALEHSDHL